jgi:hypothetical protein
MKPISTSDLKKLEGTKLLDELLNPPRIERTYPTPQCNELATLAALLLRGSNYEEAVSRAAALWECADRKLVEMKDESKANQRLPVFTIKKLPFNLAAKDITRETRPDRAKIKLSKYIKDLIQKRHKASQTDAIKIAASIFADLENEGMSETNLQSIKQHYFLWAKKNKKSC